MLMMIMVMRMVMVMMMMMMVMVYNDDGNVGVDDIYLIHASEAANHSTITG